MPGPEAAYQNPRQPPCWPGFRPAASIRYEILVLRLGPCPNSASEGERPQASTRLNDLKGGGYPGGGKFNTGQLREIPGKKRTFDAVFVVLFVKWVLCEIRRGNHLDTVRFTRYALHVCPGSRCLGQRSNQVRFTGDYK